MTDLTGMKFGRLTVIERRDRKHGHWNWACVCECSKQVVTRDRNLLSGATSSCGCFHSERMQTVSKTHGMSKTRVWNIWSAMICRCYTPTIPSYKRYGGRGITVCDRWRHSFENFREDMGDPTTESHELDRIDVNGNYEPDNCRWATQKEQARNTRRNIFLTFNGERLCISEWAERTGLRRNTIDYRLASGWSVERCLSTPADVKFRAKGLQHAQ